MTDTLRARIESLANDARTLIANADRPDDWKQGAREGVGWMERYILDAISFQPQSQPPLDRTR